MKGRKVKIRLLSIIFVIIICLLIGIFNKLNSKTEINKNGTVERIGYKGEDRSYANTREQDTTPPVVEAYFEQRPRDDGKEGMMSRTVISSNEEIQPVEGWSLSRNKKTLTKIIDGYNENEKIIIKDLAGNETEIESRHYSAYVVYEQKEESVKVRITILREEIQEIEGWVWLDDIKCMEKSYYDGIEEKVAIRSREGESIVDIYVNTKMLQDKEPPVATVTYNKTELTNESVTATITANEEILAIGGWELAENGKELRKEYHENQVEKIAIIDLAGHIKIVEVKIDNIDKTPPIANVYYEQIEGTLRIAISANEEMQEVEGWTLSKNKKVLRKERNTGEVETVSIKDKVGNEIDVYTGNRKAMVTYFKENDMGAKVIIYNMHSRMQEVQGWVLSDNKMELVKNYTGEIEETEEKVEIKSETGEKIVDIYINTEDLKDKIPPVITLTYEQNATNGNIMVIITANEEIQGMGGWSIAENRKELRKEYHESKNEQVTVKDLAGNTKTVEIRVNIDRTPPTATVNYSSTEPTKENVVVTIIANEEIQEVEGWTLAENKQELSKEYQENKNEQVIIKDLQGNTTSVTVSVNNIDKTNPNLPQIVAPNYVIEGKYITNVNPETTKEEIMRNISSNVEYKIVKVDGTDLETNEKVGTGCKVQFNASESYTIVVKGDLNGDGSVTITDLVKIKKDIVDIAKLKEEYKKAGDLNKDQNITITDLAKMRKIIVGLIEI